MEPLDERSCTHTDNSTFEFDEPRKKIRPLPPGKDFHVFLSYRDIDEDKQWVQNLKNELEQNYNFKCCDHILDFQPGMKIVENIKLAVTRSVKTIIILSKEYQNSYWCNFEVEFTHHLSMEMKENIIIPILKEDCDIPDHLKPFTYIDARNEIATWLPRLVAAIELPEEMSKLNHTPMYIKKDPKNDPQYGRKIELILDCKKRLGTSKSGKKTLTIAIFGLPGCGKSAFLNTIFASFSTQHWIEHARSGRYNPGQQCSERVKRFTKKDYYTEKDDVLMPTFLDMTGLENDDDYETREFLQIILSGKFKNNALTSKIRRNIFFKNTDSSPYATLVKRIIVVGSSNPEVPLPVYLYSAITKVAKARDIPVFGVLTKADKYDANVSSGVRNKEEKFKLALGLEETRFCRVKNYCPDVVPSLTYTDNVIPSLDVPVLTLMKQVVTSELNDDRGIDGPERKSFCTAVTAIFIGVVVVAVFFGVVLVAMAVFSRIDIAIAIGVLSVSLIIYCRSV